jgi:hypothetical protein
MRYVGSSKARYLLRQHRWMQEHRVAPRVRHHGWWLLHNCVSHPILAFRTGPGAVWFHDWTSQHLNHRPKFIKSDPPVIGDHRLWRWHNLVGHITIGLFPVEAAFAYHDKTAAAMNVPEWV